ncbi:arginine N-succinyltransferase [Solemya velum gill symbiont]|uniref:Arginine N-succinyltransferase n=1 Tax=Solemya velum gill symbiont TaxID=2340 RepID=A0A1T2E775_SOVGS|nr:arginine N-succinyltransferase [Solemya velum gill symbiont]OOY34712.1 arginine N-succinyltransferase [Solemya velum gill symbiont]OOY37507.1 arginine N-succinyltransferase [Solemya velum gill symbiont]OOY40212.1 arginine N-succinyltransferase [Solemya velum gill symbiont]OOY44747.1 arginine N-succinyltransferase [Solemya velum gill symbiont]OOY45658.1 arginine N-succinyltransferase [Solemya velum gill symbiont]
MTEVIEDNEVQEKSKGLRGIHIMWIVLATILVTVAVTFWVVRTYIYAKDFTPVELSEKEHQTLNIKLKSLGYNPGPSTSGNSGQAAQETDEQWLRAERYSEESGKREVSFSERELNAMLANNRDLAKKLAIDMGDDLVSARLLVPLDQDFPILGGKTLRVSAGVEMAFRDAKPVVILKGVSIMGVPIPNAWLGGLKNIDLISEFGDANGFWKSFADGVENIQVEEGYLKVKLKQ